MEEQREELSMDDREDTGLYIISVAARLLEMHPQTLRKYERVGLIVPTRTLGMLRLYSSEDIGRLRMIKYLIEEKRLNLAGVELAMAMESKLLKMQEALADAEMDSELRDDLASLVSQMLKMLGAS